jgi:hypothetical protein
MKLGVTAKLMKVYIVEWLMAHDGQGKKLCGCPALSPPLRREFTSNLACRSSVCRSACADAGCGRSETSIASTGKTTVHRHSIFRAQPHPSWDPASHGNLMGQTSSMPVQRFCCSRASSAASSSRQIFSNGGRSLNTTRQSTSCATCS